MSQCHTGHSCDSHEETLDDALAKMEHERHLQRIRHKIVVLSGKGGVGKSTVAVNLAMSLAMAGRTVGLLDIDLHGPSIPTMLKLADAQLDVVDGKLIPAGYEALKVISVGFLLERPEDAVIWRGPMKAGVIKQFVHDVEWGNLDYLIVDCPPGTGDEPLSIVQTLGACDGAVIVTTPQDVALTDVRRSISFCRKVNLPVLGVVENMSGLVCPHCDQVVEVFKTGGGEAMAREMGVPFLGRLPLDPNVVQAGDAGHPFVHRHGRTITADTMEQIALGVLATCEQAPSDESSPRIKETTMRIAIPVLDGQLSMHFGHCDQFALVDVDPAQNNITDVSYLTPPPHAPGLLPRWLHEQGATTIIAGGMGSRAQDLFSEHGITVITGAPVDTPTALVTAFLENTLATGDNTCDH